MVEERRARPAATALDIIIAAVQKTGRQDRGSGPEALLKSYSPVLQVADCLGDSAEQAVKNLESRGPVTTFSLRSLRTLHV